MLNLVSFIETSLSWRVHSFLGMDANKPNRTVIVSPGEVV